MQHLCLVQKYRGIMYTRPSHHCLLYRVEWSRTHTKRVRAFVSGSISLYFHTRHPLDYLIFWWSIAA